MTSDVILEERILSAVQKAITKYGAKYEELIPILSLVNREFGYLPSRALENLSIKLNTPKSKLFSVASFYEMLSTIPVGKHIFRFCKSAPCHVVGGRNVYDALLETLGYQTRGNNT